MANKLLTPKEFEESLRPFVQKFNKACAVIGKKGKSSGKKRNQMQQQN